MSALINLRARLFKLQKKTYFFRQQLPKWPRKVHQTSLKSLPVGFNPKCGNKFIPSPPEMKTIAMNLRFFFFFPLFSQLWVILQSAVVRTFTNSWRLPVSLILLYYYDLILVRGGKRSPLTRARHHTSSSSPSSSNPSKCSKQHSTRAKCLFLRW